MPLSGEARGGGEGRAGGGGGGGGGGGQGVGCEAAHGEERGERDEVSQLTVPVLLVVAGRQRAGARRPRRRQRRGLRCGRCQAVGGEVVLKRQAALALALALALLLLLAPDGQGHRLQGL